MTCSYRECFLGREAGENYDGQEYRPGSYSELLWILEQQVLKELFARFSQTHTDIDYLDFAAGTGRIAAFFENSVARSTAVEISDSMAARASARLHRTTVLCEDITCSSRVPDRKYDLITAFRFFLNAEPELRLQAMKALAARLRDQTSWLLFNNHGNFWSVKLLDWPYHHLMRNDSASRACGNYMSNAEVRQLVSQAGLEIIATINLGFLGGHISKLLPFQTALKLEAHLAALPLLRQFGQDVIYVTRPLNEAEASTHLSGCSETPI